MQLFVARPPIFDRSREGVGYELLLRSGFHQAVGSTDGSQASAEVISLGLGLDRFKGGRKRGTEGGGLEARTEGE